MCADFSDLRRTVALACRILANAGLAEDVLGHVSVRVGADELLVRCRGPEESGLLFTELRDIRRVGIERGSDPGEGYVVPNELPIHVELMRARPEVQAVVHCHPPSTLIAGLAGIVLRPVFGSYNIPAFRLASDGIPVHPRSALLRTPALAREMVDAMGDAPVCLLRGHGVTTVGSSIEQAVVRALNVEALARVSIELAAAGSEPPNVPAEDAAELPDLGSAFNDSLVWRHQVLRLEHAGLSIS